MAEFVYLKTCCDLYYPIGIYYADTYKYVKEVAKAIHNTFPEGKITLIVRGHSGTILAGGIGQLLTNRKRDVTISISRKEVSSHGENLEGIDTYSTDGSKLIVIDDFIQSGAIIAKVLDDLVTNIDHTSKFDMLCIANHWDNDDLIKGKGNPNWEVNNLIASHFKYICCNNPQYE